MRRTASVKFAEEKVGRVTSHFFFLFPLVVTEKNTYQTVSNRIESKVGCAHSA